jgi:hypothetical protein
VNAWGVVRGTKDVDIVADPEPDNVARLADVAVAINGVVKGRDSIAGSRFSIGAAVASGERVLIDTMLGGDALAVEGGDGAVSNLDTGVLVDRERLADQARGDGLGNSGERAPLGGVNVHGERHETESGARDHILQALLFVHHAQHRPVEPF